MRAPKSTFSAFAWTLWVWEIKGSLRLYERRFTYSWKPETEQGPKLPAPGDDSGLGFRGSGFRGLGFRG